MKAIILAAGMARRLNGEVKCLKEIQGYGIPIHRMVRTLFLNGVRDLTVVVGYHAGEVIAGVGEALAEVDFPHTVHFVYTPVFATTGTMRSLHSAIVATNDRGGSLVLNADLVINPEALATFLRCAATSKASLSHAMLDRHACGAEEVKAMLSETAPLTVTRIGKDLLPSECVGETVGVYWFSEALMFSLGVEGQSREWDTAYYEDAVDRLLQIGRYPLVVWTIEQGEVMEFDTPEDVATIEAWLRAFG